MCQTGRLPVLSDREGKALAQPGQVPNCSFMAATRERRRKACLISHHPLVFEEFGRRLEAEGFALSVYSMANAVSPRLSRMPVPEADVYVVDTFPASELLISRIHERFPDAGIVALAGHFVELNAFPLLQAGARGLLTYREAPKNLGRVLRTTAEGAFWVPRALMGRFVLSLLSSHPRRSLPRGSSRLSPRQKQVLDALMENLSNKEIASRLHVGERTVKFHVSSLLAKFHVRRRTDLILLGYQERSAA